MKNTYWAVVISYTILYLTPITYSQTASVEKSASIYENKTLNEYTTFGKEFFPTNLKKTLIYESSFGDLELKVTTDKESYLFSYDSDRFKYRQKLFVDEKGLFINESYQKIKLLLFITKEGKYVYDRPLLRVPIPLQIGQEWTWEGSEFTDDDTHTIKLNGKASKIETITTPAGKFETIKVETTLETSAGTKNIFTEWYAKDLGMVKMLVSIEGGGMLGFARDILGYGTIEFELKEIKDK